MENQSKTPNENQFWKLLNYLIMTKQFNSKNDFVLKHDINIIIKDVDTDNKNISPLEYKYILILSDAFIGTFKSIRFGTKVNQVLAFDCGKLPISDYLKNNFL